MPPSTAQETQTPNLSGKLRIEALEAYRSGDFKKAMRLIQHALTLDSLRWFREQGHSFVVPNRENTSFELIVGLALAARGIVEDLGDDASLKLAIAANGLESVAAFHIALERDVQDTPEAVANTMLEFLFIGMDLGRVDAMMTWSEAGVLSAFEALELDRERRRFGANKVNAVKATLKQASFAEAIRITGKNPTLSNEELAELIKTKIPTVKSIRSLTDQIRLWRRDGMLPPQMR